MLHYCNYEGCGASFTRPWKLKIHLQKHAGTPTYKCTVKDCDKIYYTSSHLNRHIQTKHENKKEIKEYKCEYKDCESIFSTSWGLRRHIKNHGHKLCEQCGKYFRKITSLTEHILTSHCEPSFQCKLCGARFQDKKKCVAHRSKHNSYFCDEEGCLETFTYFSDYRAHLNTVHPLTYICNYCNFFCYRKDELKAHLRKSCFKPPLLYCEMDGCTKSFRYKRNLVYHVKTSHNEPNFVCPYPFCEKKIRHKSRFQFHLLLHDQQKIVPKITSKKEVEDKPIIDVAALLSVQLLENTNQE